MKKSRILLTVCTFLLCSSIALASESQGTIQAGFNLTKICKNADCSSFGNVNWKPTLNANTSGATAVSITDSTVTGYVWGDEIGWINLQPTGSGVTVNPTTGVLSGNAYANVGSWINFSPTTAPGGTTVGVSINSQGQFTGWAYVSGTNGGWMKFDCSDASTCITTDWRPIPNRTVTTQPSTNSNSSSGSSSSGSFWGGITSFVGNIFGRENTPAPVSTNISPIGADSGTNDNVQSHQVGGKNSGGVSTTDNVGVKNNYTNQKQATTTVLADSNPASNGSIWHTIAQSPITKIAGVAVFLGILLFLVRMFL